MKLKNNHRNTLFFFFFVFVFLHGLFSNSRLDNAGLSKLQSENIAEALLYITCNKLEQNRADPVAHSLLKFAFFFAPDHPKAFLLLGIIESGKEIPQYLIAKKTSEEVLVQNLVHLASKREKDYLNLILWKLIKTLSPENKTATIELQSVKRKGQPVDLENLIQFSLMELPQSLTKSSFSPELPHEIRRKIVSLSSSYARLLFKQNRSNSVTPKLIEFGKVIDFENEELILLEAQIEDDFTISEEDFAIKEILLSYLKIATKRKYNSELLNFVLHSTILLIDSDQHLSIASVQKAKQKYFLNSFNSILHKYRTERMNVSEIKNQNLKSSKIIKVINLQLADFLTQKKWVLESSQTNEEWFFTFKKTRLTPQIGGHCEGKIGNHKHSWNQWNIINKVLIIDGYARYRFSPKEKIWKQLDGRKNTILR